MHGFTDLVHTSEGKRQIGDSSRDLGSKESLLNAASSFNEFDSIVVVFLYKFGSAKGSEQRRNGTRNSPIPVAMVKMLGSKMIS
jgi:hypothetical protein